MRDQCAGNVSDGLKFALLDALAGEDRTFGITWYCGTGDDRGAAGRYLEWRNVATWRLLNAQLHAGLSALKECIIVVLKRALICSKADLFHREPVKSRVLRNVWGHKFAARNGADRTQVLVGAGAAIPHFRARLDGAL